MNDIVQSILNSAGAFIESLAHTLGTTALHIYAVLVRQQSVEGILGVASIAVLVFGSVGIAILLDKLVSRAFPENYMVSDKVLVLVMGMFVGLFVLSNALPPLSLAINKIVNPEYFAIIKILSEVK